MPTASDDQGDRMGTTPVHDAVVEVAKLMSDQNEELAALRAALAEAEKVRDAYRKHAEIAEAHSEKWLADKTAAEARCAEAEKELDEAKRANGEMTLVWARGEDARLAAEAERDRLAKALKPFTLPESYVTDEEECRKNAGMDWCAVHSFRWPCPVGPARAALAGGGAAEREEKEKGK